VSLDADGKPHSNPEATACFVFDRLDAARQFCEAKVLALPHMRCEIYDAEGLAHPPLMVIVHPESATQRRNRLVLVAPEEAHRHSPVPAGPSPHLDRHATREHNRFAHLSRLHLHFDPIAFSLLGFCPETP
jgi:hypothetical protein